MEKCFRNLAVGIGIQNFPEGRIIIGSFKRRRNTAKLLEDFFLCKYLLH
jgi:hypothetical protein